MNGLDRIRSVLKGTVPDRTPVFPLVHYGTSHAAGYTIGDFSRNAEINARCLIHGYRTCGYDGIHPAVAVMVEGEAVGGRAEYPEDNIPFIKDVFLQKPDLSRLEMPDPLEAGTMPLIIESTRICAQAIGTEAYISPILMGPLNSASQIRGVESLMLDTIERPEFVEALLDFTIEMGIRYGQALVDAGAHGCFVGEAICSPVFINPKWYERVVLPRQRRLIDALLAYGAESIILHICDDTTRIMKAYAQDTGASIIDLDWKVDVAQTLSSPALQGVRTLVRGNLNPAGELFTGTPEQVFEASKELIESVGANPRFILGSGCTMNPDSLPERTRAMVAAAERFGRFQ